MKILLPTLFLSFSSIGISYADFQNGMNAFDKGEYKIALKEFKPLANRGDIDAQYILGVMYDDGKGVTKDNKQAIKWYRKAADQGDIDAQNNLDAIYEIVVCDAS